MNSTLIWATRVLYVLLLALFIVLVTQRIVLTWRRHRE